MTATAESDSVKCWNCKKENGFPARMLINGELICQEGEDLEKLRLCMDCYHERMNKAKNGDSP